GRPLWRRASIAQPAITTTSSTTTVPIATFARVRPHGRRRRPKLSPWAVTPTTVAARLFTPVAPPGPAGEASEAVPQRRCAMRPLAGDALAERGAASGSEQPERRLSGKGRSIRTRRVGRPTLRPATRSTNTDERTQGELCLDSVKDGSASSRVPAAAS